MNKLKDFILKKKNYINSFNELSYWIDDNLIPKQKEKNKFAEVSTPYILRHDMLDSIPLSFWKDPDNKVLEPCCGKGGFLVDIIQYFMKGLKDKIKDEKKRYKHIVENQLYFADINKINIETSKLLLNPNNKFKLNYHLGDSLKLNIESIWKIKGFNAVIGNPPYEKSLSVGTGNTIWQDFVKEAINNWLLKDGYLLFVHPPGWRKPESEKSKNKGLFKLMTSDNTMIYLEMHNIKDGIDIFKCGTKYDWYLLKKVKNKNSKTIINDEKCEKHRINLKNIPWLSNYNIELSIKLLSRDKNDVAKIIYNRTNYDVEKDYISKTKSKKYKYPVIHSTSITSKNKIFYSSRNDKGHYGIKKVIFGDSSIGEPVKDKNGIYAMSEHAMAIEVDNNKELEDLYNVLKSDKFKDFIKSCTWSNFQIDWRLFTYLKKDFWKNFI